MTRSLEGLRQVVVGARLEAAQHVLGAAPGGEHEHGDERARAPQLGRHVEAVRAGQHHVEQDHVEGGALGEQEFERRLAVGGRLDLVAFGLKVEAEAVAEVLLVFDD